ncbi:MAG TPA: hypothetical protein VMF61_02215, partial [Candidatus Acidoferrales bacterium]|nr:hypothetical protein [Candidatus Acidoferrales bacterium]
FNTLVKRNFTSELLAAGHVKLYEHGVAVAAAISAAQPSKPYAILDAIERVFAGTSPGEAELGLAGANYFTLPPSRYPQYYRYQYLESGLRPNAANVDVPYMPPSAIRFTPENVRAWKAWTLAGRSAGIESMAPIVAPNLPWEAGNPIFPPTRAAYYDIASPFYRLSRFEATYGGGIAFDAPPKFFLSGGSGAGYQRFIEQAIRWGNGHGLRTTALISPYSGRSDFTADTRTFVGALARHHAVPSEWAVDDYESTDPNDAKAMGPDTVVDTTTNVALWLAENAPIFVRGSENDTAAGGLVCRPR